MSKKSKRPKIAHISTREPGADYLVALCGYIAQGPVSEGQDLLVCPECVRITLERTKVTGDALVEVGKSIAAFGDRLPDKRLVLPSSLAYSIEDMLDSVAYHLDSASRGGLLSKVERP